MIERTAAQATASRANGAQSHGPTTDRGKAISAVNSRKHGLCSKEFVLDDASEQVRFDSILKELHFTHQAKNELEQEACHHLAVAMWRRRVCDNLEKELMQAIAQGDACAQLGGNGLPNLGTINRYRARIARDLKEARTEIRTLKAERAAAFEAEMHKASEFTSQAIRQFIQEDMGDKAYRLFRDTVTNEPEASSDLRTSTDIEPAQTNPSKTQTPDRPMPKSRCASKTPIAQAEINRRNRRIKEKVARKQKHKQS